MSNKYLIKIDENGIPMIPFNDNYSKEELIKKLRNIIKTNNLKEYIKDRKNDF